MDTTVITVEELDYGVGKNDRVKFVDCSWHVDNIGTLHIKRESGRGNCGAFASGTWWAVVEGDIFSAQAVEA